MDVGAVGSEDVVYVKRQVGLYAAVSVGEFGLSYIEVRYGAFGLQSVYVQQNGTVLEDAAEVTYAIQRQGSRRGVYRKLYLVQEIREAMVYFFMDTLDHLSMILASVIVVTPM